MKAGNFKRTVTFALAALMIAGGASLFAQERMTLNVTQAVELGLQNNKLLKISAARAESQRAKVDEVNANKYAWLKLSASYTRLSPVDPFKIQMPFGPAIEISPSIYNNYSAKLSAVQPLYTGNKITAGIEAAQFASDALEQDYRKDKDDISLNIKTAYWQLFKAREVMKLLDENVQQVKAHVDDAKNLLKAGMATRNDVLKLEVQEADIKFRQADAANGAALAAIALNNVLGIHLATNIELTENPKEKSDSYASLDQMVLSSFNLRPDLKAAGLRVQASESGIEIANSAWYPQISLIGNYTFAQPNQRIFPTKNQFFGTWDLSLGLSFDIWDWNSRFYQTQQAEAQRIQAREAVNVIKDGVSLEITSNFLTMNQAGEKIKIAGFAKQQAEENYRIYGERFKQGLALSSELIDAEAAYLQAKTNFTTSVVDYEIALAKLQKSIGESNQ